MDCFRMQTRLHQKPMAYFWSTAMRPIGTSLFSANHNQAIRFAMIREETVLYRYLYSSLFFPNIMQKSCQYHWCNYITQYNLAYDWLNFKIVLVELDTKYKCYANQSPYYTYKQADLSWCLHNISLNIQYIGSILVFPYSHFKEPVMPIRCYERGMIPLFLERDVSFRVLWCGNSKCL